MTNHCDDEVLSAFSDGDLVPDEAGRVAEHLATCTACRAALTEVRAIRDEAGAMEELEPPPRVWRGIQERLRAAPKRRALPVWAWAWAPALAAAAVLVVLFVGKHPAATVSPTPQMAKVESAPEPVPPPAVAATPAATEHRSASAVSPHRVRPKPAPVDDVVASEAATGYEDFMRGMEQAVVECRSALDENPGNMRVRMALLGAQSSRVTGMDRLVSGGD